MSASIPPTDDPTARPIVAASVAVFRAGEVLLVKRAKPPFLWSLPGGQVEHGETLRAAALRELHEETGVEAHIVAQVEALEVMPHEAAGHHYVIVNFAARYLSGTASAASDAAAVAWVSADDLPAYDMTANARRIIASAATLATS